MRGERSAALGAIRQLPRSTRIVATALSRPRVGMFTFWHCHPFGSLVLNDVPQGLSTPQQEGFSLPTDHLLCNAPRLLKQLLKQGSLGLLRLWVLRWGDHTQMIESGLGELSAPWRPHHQFTPE